jgi:hypothetical protein
MFNGIFNGIFNGTQTNSEEDNFGTLLISRIVFADTLFELFDCDAKNLVRKIDNWSFNRSLRQGHASTLNKALENMENPHLLGSIKIATNPSNEYRVFDGQHRLSAIKKKLNEDETMDWNMNVIVELYHVKNIEDNLEMYDLFSRANNTLNINEEDLPDMHLMNIIGLLADDPILSKGIIKKDNDNYQVYKPRIKKSELFEEFKKYYKPPQKQEIDKVIKKVKEINNIISIKSRLILFGNIPKGKKSKVDHQWAKAERDKFYLNIGEGNFLPSVWIPYIYNGQEL